MAEKPDVILHVLRRIEAKLDAILDRITAMEESLTNVEAATGQLATLRAGDEARLSSLDEIERRLGRLERMSRPDPA